MLFRSRSIFRQLKNTHRFHVIPLNVVNPAVYCGQRYNLTPIRQLENPAWRSRPKEQEELMPQHHTTGPALPTKGAPAVSDAPDNSATIALLEHWARAEATDDATAIAEAERELSEFKAALNANRPPDRPIFP